MREKTVVPTTLLDWPKVIDLLPEQKLILLSLWAGRYTNSIGIIQNPPLPAMAVSVGLSRQAFETGLDNLQHAGCINWDREAGEICVVDWFRFHQFKGVGVGIAKKEAGKVCGQKVAGHLKKVAPWLFETASYPQSEENQQDGSPTPTSTPTSTKPPPPMVAAEGGGVDSLEDFVAAAVALAEPPPRNPVRFAAAVRRRLRAEGPTEADKADLARWRKQHVNTTACAGPLQVEGRLAALAALAGKAVVDAAGAEVGQVESRSGGFTLRSARGVTVLAGSEAARFLAAIAAGRLLVAGQAT